VPDAERLFTFSGQSYGAEWCSITLPETTQQQLSKIAIFIVSTLHLAPVGTQHLQWNIASISKMFDIALLVGTDAESAQPSDTGADIELALLDVATGTVTPTAFARRIAP